MASGRSDKHASTLKPAALSALTTLKFDLNHHVFGFNGTKGYID